MKDREVIFYSINLPVSGEEISAKQNVYTRVRHYLKNKNQTEVIDSCEWHYTTTFYMPWRRAAPRRRLCVPYHNDMAHDSDL